MRWLDAQEPEGLFLSVVTIGEMAQGIARLPGDARRRAYERMVREALPVAFCRAHPPGGRGGCIIWGA